MRLPCDEERLLCVNPDYVGWKLSAADYQAIPNLKAILSSVTSYMWIDRSYADEHNIPICNVRDFSSQAVAEWAAMIMLSLARQMPRIIKDGFALDFDKDYMKYRGIELHGKTAGIIGLGNVGSAIAKRCAGLGMNVVYWSPNSRSDEYELKELDDLMTTSDVVFPALTIKPETEGILTQEVLSLMKPEAILVDMSHKLFDAQLALDMVAAGKLFGFGFEAEPASFDKYEGNVWAAPAYAWDTDQSMHLTMEKWVANMVAAADNKFPSRLN